jgi:hypothetical protein
MEWNPSREANSSSASQKFPLILWNPKVYGSLHKSLPLVAILSQLNPVHTHSSCFLNIHITRTCGWRTASRYAGTVNILDNQLRASLSKTLSNVYVFSLLLLLIVKELMTWRWPSTAETCSHRQTNKSRSYHSCVLTDPATIICIKTQRGWWTWILLKRR